jgi:hypothetical protein
LLSAGPHLDVVRKTQSAARRRRCVMLEAREEVKPGVFVLPSSYPLGPMGTLPINAFLVKTAAPYLVDTGMIAERDEFLSRLEALIDPADLRLIVLTHTDPDHIGALHALLERAPRAKVLTNFVSSAKLEVMARPIPQNRLHLVNPGEDLDLSGHHFSVRKPAVFDAPETISVYDLELDVLFSSDSFGAPLERVIDSANDLSADELAAKGVLWATIDSPWIHYIDRKRFGATLLQYVNQDPEWVLSSHLPPAKGMIRTLCENLAKAPDAPPAPLPSQKELEAMLAAGAPAEITALGADQPQA